ncbi:GntR family transcriptional regulator [Neobacillus mesonae]|uniref:GntR family transcriptional regulator n=1 Tax=Neobacillus mesonae TaxID=1193713 RepID=UPI00203CEFF8|nr:GntR family transcriptional regulator [Neobacillus mesonae]MCM3569363.1 GntR family transcriptional regulator [Neobacillus mesonae]
MSTKRLLLKDIAYEKIKQKIINSDVEHLSENSLVEELQMSRTPIREALQRLQYEGFVKIISNQGVLVSKMSVNRLYDLIDMRVAIETFSLKQAILLMKDKDYKNIKEIIDRQKSSYEEKDLITFRENDAAFHYYLLTVTGNHYFIKMFSDVKELQYTAGSRVIGPDEMLKLITEHEKIITYMKKKDIESAIDLLTNHLNGGKRNLIF